MNGQCSRVQIGDDERPVTQAQCFRFQWIVFATFGCLTNALASLFSDVGWDTEGAEAGAETLHSKFYPLVDAVAALWVEPIQHMGHFFTRPDPDPCRETAQPSSPTRIQGLKHTDFEIPHIRQSQSFNSHRSVEHDI